MIKPLPHQEVALSEILRGFEKHERGQAIMACATGKTFVGMWTAERLGAEKVLVTVPSISLLSQMLREWKRGRNGFTALAVCSDDTVAEDVSVTTARLSEDVAVTTDPEEISDFLRKGGKRVIFSTYQSSRKIADAMNGDGFDLIVADEAHRCVGAVDKLFATIVDEDAIKAKRRLFMTATPRVFTGDDESVSMDQEEDFGPVFHELKFSEAVALDLLSDYRVAIVLVTNDDLRKHAIKATPATIDGERLTDVRSLCAQVAIAKAMKRYDLRRIISFHNRVVRARKFGDSFLPTIEWVPESAAPDGDIWSSHINGKMRSSARDAILDRLRKVGEEERALVTNCKCLSEGVDVPALDGIAFIDSKKSVIEIVQAVGRVMRKSEGKERGIVVLPVLVDENQDAEEVLKGDEFGDVWSVLKALRSHDDEIAGKLDRLRSDSAKGEDVPLDAIREKIDIIGVTDLVRLGDTFARSICIKVLENTTSSWNFYFGLLERFAMREKHTDVPVGHRERGYSLYSWVAAQRRMKKDGSLRRDAELALDTLMGGGVWYWDFDEYVKARWEREKENGKYQRSVLEAFVAKENHARIPVFGIDYRDYPIGEWWAGIRRKAADGTLKDSEREAIDQAILRGKRRYAERKKGRKDL